MHIVNPLSTYLTLIEIPTNKIITKNLICNHEPINIPHGSSSILYKNRVIITGGTIDFVNHLKSCYEYSLMIEKIEKQHDLIVSLSCHSMIEANGRLYVLGGKNEDGHLNKCESCLISANGLKDYSELYKWKEIAPLNEAKYGITAYVYDNAIYVFGGIGYEKIEHGLYTHVAQAKSLGTIEKFNIGDDKWRIIGSIKDFSGYFLGVVDGKYQEAKGFYIFGGLHKKGEPMKHTYFLKDDGLEEYKNRELIKIENCGFTEKEGLRNRGFGWEIGVEKIWVAGEERLKYMCFDENGGGIVLTVKEVYF